MIAKIIASISLIGVLILSGFEYLQWISQQEQLRTFMNKGPRFTAYDGKELCEYMNSIAVNSIDFQRSGLLLMNCEKYTRNK
jgi:hypothetical protein